MSVLHSFCIQLETYYCKYTVIILKSIKNVLKLLYIYYLHMYVLDYDIFVKLIQCN
jgi:hypothetical protein